MTLGAVAPHTNADVVIVGAVRTPIGRGHPTKGMFRDVLPHDLLAAAYHGVLRQAGVRAEDVDEVLTGCVQQLGPQGTNMGRNAWLHAGLPVSVPASTVDTQCGASQQAVNLATALIASGSRDVVLAAGVEHMGLVPFASGVQVQQDYGDAVTAAMTDQHGLITSQNLVGMGAAAERIATQWELSRDDLDAWALRSHRLADLASRRGAFDREIVAVTAVDNRADQGIRPGISLNTLAQLTPPFAEDGRLTAGTSSQVSDGAAAVLLMSATKAAELGITPRARVLDHLVVGDDPRMMLTAPIPLTRKLLQRNAMSINDIDLTEINEAFASVVLAWLADIEPDRDRVNPRGGAIALGHPLGASGARLITTLVHEMEDLDAETGLVTMCCAGGLATGTLLQRI